MPPPGASRASVGEVTEPTPRDLPRTLGELRAAGHGYRTVKEELRDNLLARMRAGEPRFPGIVGYDDTVLPEVERAHPGRPRHGAARRARARARPG